MVFFSLLPYTTIFDAICASRRSALWPDRLMQRRTLRSPGRADCAFPSRCGARGVWGNPPPGCGALWRMPQLGKCARATTRQPAGRVARVSADLGSEPNLTEGRTLPDRRAPECAFPSRRDRRMRLSVECAFPHLGKRGAASRKSAFWPDRLTERRTLAQTPHGKAHSAIPMSRRLRLSVTLRRPGGVGQPPARLRGTMENGSTGQTRSSNHPPACGAGCARARRSRFGVRPHGKAHSAYVGVRLKTLALAK